MKPKEIRKKILEIYLKYRSPQNTYSALNFQRLKRDLGCTRDKAEKTAYDNEFSYLLKENLLESATVSGTGIQCYSISNSGIKWLEENRFNIWRFIGNRIDQIVTAGIVALVTTLITNWLTKK